MPAQAGQQPYEAVSAIPEDNGRLAIAKRRRQNEQFNFKPVPLRVTFLSTFILVLAVLIALIEVLLHSTSSPSAPSTAVTAFASATALTKSAPKYKRQYRTHPTLVKREIDCGDVAGIPSKLASLSEVSSNLCSDFTASYAQHTANLSYPLQTALGQWLDAYESMTAFTQDLAYTSTKCQQSSTTQMPSYVDAVVFLGCSTTVQLYDGGCKPPEGTLWIENFALTSTVVEYACSVNREDVVVIASNTGTVSATINLAASIAPDLNTEDVTPVIVTKLQTSIDKNSLVVITKPGSSAILPASMLPTVKKPAEEVTDTPVVSGPALPTVTQPIEMTTASAPPKDAAGSQAATITAAPAISHADSQLAGMVQTIVTKLEAVSPVLVVYTTADTLGQAHIITTELDAFKPLPATYLITDSLGHTQTITTSLNGITPLAVTYINRDSLGQVHTVVTSVDAIQGSTSVLTTTNEAEEVETLVAIVGILAPTLQTYLTTDVQGNVQTFMLAWNVLAFSLSTYMTTDPLGKVSTIVTQVSASQQPLSTYLTTNEKGEILTVATVVEATAVSPDHKYTTTTQYTSLVTRTGTDGKLTSFSAVVVESIVLTSIPAVQTVRPTTTSTSPPSSTSRSPHPSFVLSSSEKVVNGTFTKYRYVVAMYLPACLAVLVKLMWEIVFASINLLQPFERMAAACGVDAQYSIFAQYLSSAMSLDMFMSLGYGNLVPLWSVLLYLIVQIGAPLAAISMTVKSRDTCLIDGRQNRCDLAWVVNVPVLRGLECALIACMVLIALVWWSIRGARSGLSSDPSSLASLALLMNQERLLQDIRNVEPDANHSDFEAAFAQRQFRLSHHITTAGFRKYSIVAEKNTKLLGLPDENDNITTAYERNMNSSTGSYTYQSVHNPASITDAPISSYTRASCLTHTRNNRIADLLGLIFPITLLALVTAFYLDDDFENPLNKFFNSNTPAPKILLVSLASLSSLHLSHIERSVRITEPFRRLAANAPPGPQAASGPAFWRRRGTSRARAPPETTVLISRSGTRYSSLPLSLSLLVRHELHGGRILFQTLVSLTAVLSDLNIIAAAGVAYNDAMTWEVYKYSSIVTMAVTGWIVLMYVVILVWWRRNEAVQVVGGKSISKSVGTIGGVMRWLAGGGPEVVEAIGRVKEERETWRGWRRRYGCEGGDGTRVWFGRTGVIGADGRGRWCLAFERTGATNEIRKQGGSTQGLGLWF